MKEIYQAMKECDWQGTPEEYLKWWIKNQAKKIDKKNENINNNNNSGSIANSEDKQDNKE